ncbi:MAG: RHS repeat-associated core domain-containing protein [Desulfuromonadales bacterium]|nr:RHS repeat-associated core domain-containing protein [Desulfuromonadales bacterium]
MHDGAEVLQYPGQYYDAETGLNYNYSRDYNPAIGRYVEADTIGIKSGDNHLYVYVQNNPINLTDPNGWTGYPGVGIDCSGWADVANFFNDFFSSTKLANEAYAKISKIRKTIPCNAKRNVTICFIPGSPPSNLSVAIGDGAYTSPNSFKCTVIEVTGNKDCNRCSECHK